MKKRPGKKPIPSKKTPKANSAEVRKVLREVKISLRALHTFSPAAIPVGAAAGLEAPVTRCGRGCNVLRAWCGLTDLTPLTQSLCVLWGRGRGRGSTGVPCVKALPSLITALQQEFAPDGLQIRAQVKDFLSPSGQINSVNALCAYVNSLVP